MEKKVIRNFSVEMVGNGYILTYEYDIERNGGVEVFEQKFIADGKESLIANIKSLLGIE